MSQLVHARDRWHEAGSRGGLPAARAISATRVRGCMHRRSGGAPRARLTRGPSPDPDRRRGDTAAHAATARGSAGAVRERPRRPARVSWCGERIRRSGSAPRRCVDRARDSSCSHSWRSRAGRQPWHGGGVGAWPTHARSRTIGWCGTSWLVSLLLSGASGSWYGRSAARPGLVPMPLSGLGAIYLASRVGTGSEDWAL